VAKALREFERPHVRALDLMALRHSLQKRPRTYAHGAVLEDAQFLSENGWPSGEGSTRHSYLRPSTLAGSHASSRSFGAMGLSGALAW
jgi:hypothetical protein